MNTTHRLLCGITCVGLSGGQASAASTFQWSSVPWGGGGAPYQLDPQKIIDLAGTPELSKPGALVDYVFYSGVPGNDIWVQVMVRNMNKFSIVDADSVYFEGQTGTVQSTLRMRFFEVDGSTFPTLTPGAAKAVDNIHFMFEDAESSEWLYHFGIYDGSESGYSANPNDQNLAGYQPTMMLDFDNLDYFTFSGGNPLLKELDPTYACNNEFLQGGTQLGKTVDVNLSNVDFNEGYDVYGFEVSFRRNHWSAGGMLMTFQAPEPAAGLLSLIGFGLLVRRRRCGA